MRRYTMNPTPSLIVIEGLDGSGKATQAKLLAEHLRDQGKQVTKISFPDYENPSSTLVQLYLSGKIGTLDQVNAYAASSFYAVDRYVSYETIWKESYLAGHTIIADRYVLSNAIHQMSKLERREWNGYLAWLHDYEYGRLALPQPDLVLYLDMQPETSRRLIQKRYHGDDSKQDIHEQDLSYLNKCRDAALYTAALQNWQIVRCCNGQQPDSIAEIARRVAAIVDEELKSRRGE